MLLRDLCELHGVSLPSELDTLLQKCDMSPPNGEPSKATVPQSSETITIKDSDDEIDSESLESDPDSEEDEDFSMEIEAVRNAKRVCHFNSY